MKSSYFNVSALWNLCLLAKICLVAGFAPNPPSLASYRRKASMDNNLRLNSKPTPEESAQAFRDYIVKSHQAKIEALKQLEDEKNKEIKALKESLKDKASSPSSIPSTELGSQASEEDEMRQKLQSYQSFMADYIVKAQEDKARAVREAKATTIEKFENKLQALEKERAQSDKSKVPDDDENNDGNDNPKGDGIGTDDSIVIFPAVTTDEGLVEVPSDKAEIIVIDNSQEEDVIDISPDEASSTSLNIDSPRVKNEVKEGKIDIIVEQKRELEFTSPTEIDDWDLASGRFLTALSFSLAFLSILQPDQMQAFIQTFFLMRSAA